MKHVYIGTSGYNYKDWKNKLYVGVPQKDWLMYYSLFFNTVEVNATFYRSFPKSVFEKWHDITSDDFTFTIKGPRLITHYQKLHNVEENLKKFFDSISELQDKLAIVLWQFPAQFKRTKETEKSLINFFELMKQLRQTTDAKRYGHPNRTSKDVIELRNTSWFTNEIYELLNTYGIGWVINDTSAFPTKEVLTGNIAYIRFHGPTALYASSYNDTQLKTWAEKIQGYAKKVNTYCYFNNDVSGYAIENAFTLTKLLQ